MVYSSCRELFEAARDATADVHRCNRALAAMDAAAASVGGGITCAVGHGHAEGDRIGRMVVAQIARREKLESRIEADYRLIDRANEVLYGADGMSDGLAEIAPAWWADAIYHHYLSLMKWADVADLLGYSEKYVIAQVRAAFELADGLGMGATVEGRGHAEG